MKRLLVIAAVLGTVISGYGLVITNDVVGDVNMTQGATYALDSSDSYYITNHTVTAKPGRNLNLSSTISADQFAFGTGGLSATGTGSSEVSVVDSSIGASSGGAIITTVPAGNRMLKADGGNAMVVNDVTVDSANATISGGNGGTIVTSLGSYNDAKPTSASGGFGIQLLGTSTLNATDTTISGGMGGSVDNVNRTGRANGGAGILITGSVTADLNLANTTVTGGNGGQVVQNFQGFGQAFGGDGLLIRDGATVTINGGAFVGGNGGSVAGVAADDGAALRINDSIVTLAGGMFEGKITLDGGDSTLSLKDTFTDDAPFLQTDGTVTFDEWYDGQLQDVTVAGGTMNFNYGSNPFNLTGDFQVTGAAAGDAEAKFLSGLTVKDGGTLDAKLSSVTANGAETESGSIVKVTRNDAGMGKIASTGDLTLNDGTKWIISDIGGTEINVGDTLDLATASGTIVNNLNIADVLYSGINGSAGWLGSVTNVVVNGPAVQAVYGLDDINARLGVEGDDSNYGKAMADLTMLVPQGSTAYDNLGDVTQDLQAAGGIMTNGFTRAPEVARTLARLPSIISGQIQNRIRSQLHSSQVGYPVAAAPMGAGGWDFMRNLSNRLENNISLDGMRAYSDQQEERFGYKDVKSSMNDLRPDMAYDGFDLSPDWQIWGRGYGSTIKQDERDEIAGYEATIGGGMLGIDKRVNNLLLGFGGGYIRTEVDGDEYNYAAVDTGHIAAYLAAHGDHAYLDVNLGYTLNGVDTEMEPLGYSGNYNAHTVSFFLGGGYAMALTDWLMLTPDASIQATYYTHGSYKEESSLGLPDKEYESYDQVVPLSAVGATLSTIRQVDVSTFEIAVQPELRAHWLHDFNADMDSESYMMSGGANIIDTPLLAAEEDLFQVGAGVRFSKWNSYSTEVGIDVDGTFGEDYNAFLVSAKIQHRF